MLLLAEVDAVLQKKVCKRNSIWFGSSTSGNVVFILLAKVITFYVGLTIVDVRGFDLEFVFRSIF